MARAYTVPVVTAVKTGFLDAVRVEPLPNSLHWGRVDWIVLATIPVIFVSFYATQALGWGAWAHGLADSALRVALFALLVWCYRDLLARHWQGFRRAFWRSAGLVVAAAVVMQVIITVVRALMGSLAQGKDMVDPALRIDVTTLTRGGVFVLLLISLGPVAMSLIEDTVFRHTLLMKLPVWDHKPLAALVVVANAWLFGAIHYYNYGGLLPTVPMACAGLFMNAIYLWTRNIWHVLLMHALNNFVLSIAPTLVFLAFPVVH
jgi:membrane protease YdiL (CAAX protease family)